MKKNGKNSYDVIVVGGGAAGLCAAITAASEGARTLIIEKNTFCGKKLLSTGNGRCNFTNEDMSTGRFYSKRMDVIEEILDRFPTASAVSFFSSLGILPMERDGYYYPFTNRAKDVTRCFSLALRELGIDTRNEQTVTEIVCKNTPEGLSFFIGTKEKPAKDGPCAKTCIIATGGLAAPKSGTTGDGYGLAEQFGHHTIPTHPALVRLCCSDKDLKRLGGLRGRATLRLLVEGVEVYREFGEIQFNKDGLSGIPVLSASRLATEALSQKKKVAIALNVFSPDIADAKAFLIKRTKNKSIPISEALCGMLPNELISVVLDRCRIRPELLSGELEPNKVDAIYQMMEKLTFTVTDSKGYEFAQTTAGGVDLGEILPDTMESKLVPGLFFAGEILDGDGICGGYNLHFAWATGTLAGRAASQHSQRGKNRFCSN